MSEYLRAEYPRPQFQRNSWINLNGEWEFAFDDEAAGTAQNWHVGDHALPMRIQVPFAFQSKLSGIGDPSFHDIVWYRRSLSLPESFKGKNVILHFGAVDYFASVWVNGELVGSHEGGHTPFCADITAALKPTGNSLVVKAVDYSRDLSLPRGKQYWQEKSEVIFYTRTTGIWQTVWAEAVSGIYLAKVKLTPDIDRKSIEISAFVEGLNSVVDIRLRAVISFGNEIIAEDLYKVVCPVSTRCITLPDSQLWSPEHPNLYDVSFTLLQDGLAIDEATSYFGMRKISIDGNRLCLNNRPYFLKFVLDQGYFPDGNLTPPSDGAIKRDVELAKEMGFNGARKHQKLEDPRWLYWCDKLGLLVWSEAANSYEFTDNYVRRFINEWQESIERDYNHPSIIAWVPLNESWGIPNVQVDKQQQQHALTMYHLTKSLDPTRPVVSNDGWEMVTTDLFNIHDYEWRREVLEQRYSSTENAVNARPANARLFVEGFPYAGQPILLTEFGGISYRKSEWDGWGYSAAENDEDFAERLRNVVQPLLQPGCVLQGYCYTQLTDVEQEINGLLTYDRVPKLSLETIRAINEGR